MVCTGEMLWVLGEAKVIFIYFEVNLSIHTF